MMNAFKRIFLSKGLFVVFYIALFSNSAYAAPPVPCLISEVVCNVASTSDVIFTYDVFSLIPADSQGNITVVCDCTNPTSGDINLDVLVAIEQSPNSGGFDPRQMKHITLGEMLDYNLYSDIPRTSIWGNQDPSMACTYCAVSRPVRSNGVPKVTLVYGRIPPLQDVSAGTYTETLTVTITW